MVACPRNQKSIKPEDFARVARKAAFLRWCLLDEIHRQAHAIDKLVVEYPIAVATNGHRTRAEIFDHLKAQFTQARIVELTSIAQRS